MAAGHQNRDSDLSGRRRRAVDLRLDSARLYSESPGPAAPSISEMIARPVHKKPCLPSSAILAGLVLALLGNIAHASDRTTILRYICTTYESARQVALEQGWERPESMPGDCRILIRRGFEGRIAEISQIIEVVPMGDGR